MSTKTLSPAAGSIAPYKKLLLAVEKLRGQGGENAYRRATLLGQIFDDQDFRLDYGNVDAHGAAKILDAYVEDLCLTFFQLREMLSQFPNNEQWADGRLRTMYDTLLEKRSVPEKVIKTRASATVAEVNHLKDENEKLKTKLREANKQIEQLKASNRELRDRVGV